MDREKITVWVTKWVFTLGIIEEKAEVIDKERANCGFGYLHGGDWHRTREAAVKRAKEMQIKKIASVKKQLEKLEKMRFE